LEQVVLKGEFRFPGIYTIDEGETIEDLIIRAGGLTDEAFASAAFFSRQSIREAQAKQLQESADRMEREIGQVELANQSLKDPGIIADKLRGLSAAKVALQKLRAIKPTGRLLIDIDRRGKLKGHASLPLQQMKIVSISFEPTVILIQGVDGTGIIISIQVIPL